MLCKFAFIAGLVLLIMPPLWFRRLKRDTMAADTEMIVYLLVAGAVALALILIFSGVVAYIAGWCR